ncbi:MAG TPA: FHA domain-containing protein, partial [Anaeromyxobacteraceae bacterium]|nr:FHA domain-containing protein [Anaeromyxobacteraceae bacterium]
GLRVRVAVDAGPAVAGNLAGPGGLELAAVGEPAERTERLLALAAPGEILAGAGLRGQPGLVAEPVEEMGGTAVEVYRVVE